MASRSTGMVFPELSQDLGETYKKLAATWDKKRGTRDFQANVFTNTTTKDQILHVAALLNQTFVDLHNNSNIIKELQLVEPGMVILSAHEDSMWIYDMRMSDAMPKTQSDLVRLYSFVSNLVKKHFNTDTQNYLMKHNHIVVSFVVWFFTTPSYFFATKEIKQTSRYGIKKVWRSILLKKKPNTSVEKQATIKQRGEMHQSKKLPKLENNMDAIKKKIMDVIQSEYPTITIDWEDGYEVRTKISECFDMKSKCYINGAKSKKLHKLYQDYQKMNEKVLRTSKSIKNAEIQQKKDHAISVMTINKEAQRETNENDIMGAEDINCGLQEVFELPEVVDEVEEVPESWEDLL